MKASRVVLLVILSVFCVFCFADVDPSRTTCGEYEGDGGTFKWLTGGSGKTIEITYGGCAEGDGETAKGVGYCFVSPARTDCDGDLDTSPCEDCGGACPCDCDNDGTCDNTTTERIALIKVTGSDLEKVFPSGISFTGDRWIPDTSTTNPDDGEWANITVIETGEYIELRMAGSYINAVSVSVPAISCGFEGTANFSFQIKFVEKRAGCDSADPCYHTLDSCSGSINVVENKRVENDTRNNPANPSSGSPASITPITHDFMGNDYRGSYKTQDGEGSCNSQYGYLGSNGMIIDTFPSSPVYYRVKYPDWQKSVYDRPGYIAADGWNYHANDEYASDNYVTKDMDLSSSSQLAYYNLGASGNVTDIEYCLGGEARGSGFTKWTFSYNASNKLSMVTDGDPNNIQSGDTYYSYSWTTDQDNNQTAAVNYYDEGSLSRQWEIGFDENDNLIQCGDGCSSCGGSSGEKTLYFSNSALSGLVDKKYNSNGDTILDNDYEFFVLDNMASQFDFAVNNGSFEYPSFNDETSNHSAASNWGVDGLGGDPNVCVINPSDTMMQGWYGVNDEDVPAGEQFIDPNENTIVQYLPNEYVTADTVYDLSFSVGAFGTNYSREAKVKLIATNGTAEVVLIELNPTMYAPVGNTLVDETWKDYSGLWYNDESIEGAYDGYYFKLEIYGKNVHIDNVIVTASIIKEFNSSPFLSSSKAVDPVTSNDIKFEEWVYDRDSYTAYQKLYVDNTNYRVKKFIYSDDNFNNLVSITQYAELVTSGTSPSGDSYTTTFASERIYEEETPVERQDIKKTTTHPSGVIDVELIDYNDGELMRSYSCYPDPNTIIDDNHYTYNSENQVVTQTDSRGATTAYEYSDYLTTKITQQAVNGSSQVTENEYDSTKRLDYSRTKDSDGNWTTTDYSYTSPDANDIDSRLYSIIVTGSPESGSNTLSETYYRYNGQGQVTREKRAIDATRYVVTGRKYNVKGQLESEFTLEDAADIDDSDTGLSVISQTKYEYTDDGKIEYIKRAKADSSFTLDSPTAWIQTKFEYNFLGQKTKQIEDYGNANITTQFEYNNQGELTKTIYPSGKWVDTVRDGLGRTIQVITGYSTTDYTTTYYSFDSNGNMDEVTSSDGVTTLYGFDIFGRKNSVQINSASNPYTTYTYEMREDGDVDILTRNVVREAYFDADDTLLRDIRFDYDILGRQVEKRILATPGTPSDTEDMITVFDFDVAGNQYKITQYGEPNDTYPVYEPVVLEYDFDGLNRVVKQTDADGFEREFGYNRLSQKVSEKDPNSTFEYDNYGRLSKRTDADNNYTVYTYNSLNQTVKEVVYDCKGTPETIADDVAVRQVRRSYENTGKLEYAAIMKDPASTSTIDRSVDMVTDFEYDSYGRLQYKKQYYNGSSSNIATTTYYFDNIDRNWRTVKPDGSETRVYFDSTNNSQKVKEERIEKNDDDANDTYTITSFFDYDSYGRLWKITRDKDGDGVKETSDLVVEYLYNDLGQKEWITAADGISTYFHHDTMGRMDYKIEDPDVDTYDGLHRVTLYDFDRLGNQISISGYDPNEQTTSYDYTKTGMVKKITYPDTTTIEFTYNYLGKATKKKNRDDSYIYYRYNGLGNCIRESNIEADFDVTDPNNTDFYLCEYEYSPLGALEYFTKETDSGFVSDTEYLFNGFGLPESESTYIFDSNEYLVEYDFDQMGNIINRTHNGEDVDLFYDGQRRLSSIDRNSDDIIAYQYIGSQVRGIDFEENGMTYTASYDELGRITADLYQDNDANTILDFQYDYYDNGNRKSMKYNHLSTPVWDKYYYDNLRRINTVEYGSTTAPVSMSMDTLIRFADAWLDNDHIEADNPRTRLADAKALQKITFYKKMINGELPVVMLSDTSTSTDSTVNTGVEILKDENGNNVAMIVHDDYGRIEQFWVFLDNDVKIVVFESYTSDDDVTADGSLIVAFDAFGHVEHVEYVSADSITTSSSLSSSSLSLDGGMTMMAMSEPVAPAATTDEFNYSELGNRTTAYIDKYSTFPTTVTYERNNYNQYTEIESSLASLPQTKVPDYDDNGNMIDDGSYDYTYDWRNRITDVQYGSNSLVDFEYDAIGRRIYKNNGDKETYFIYDTMGRVIAEYEEDAAETEFNFERSFVYGNGIDEVLGMFLPERTYNATYYGYFVDFAEAWLCDVNDTCYDSQWDDNSDDIINMKDYAMNESIFDAPDGWETRYYYLTDALGSVRGLVGAVHDREDDREFYNYDVFGKMDETSDVGNPYYFAGMRFDTEDNKYNKKYRTYDPILNRWLQHDPLGYIDGLNDYEYVKNNPVNNNDLYGLGTYTRGLGKRPDFEHDNGFLEKYEPREPTPEDYASLKKWKRLLALSGIKWWWDDARAAYRHFLYGNGDNFYFSYDEYISEDKSGDMTLTREIRDAQYYAERLSESPVENFSMTGSAEEADYPYTENWQKAIGGHTIWGEASVIVKCKDNKKHFEMDITVHAEDRYNFNPGQKDIGTGIPDYENGMFEITGLAKQFTQYGEAYRTVKWKEGESNNAEIHMFSETGR